MVMDKAKIDDLAAIYEDTFHKQPVAQLFSKQGIRLPVNFRTWQLNQDLPPINKSQACNLPCPALATIASYLDLKSLFRFGQVSRRVRVGFLLGAITAYEACKEQSSDALYGQFVGLRAIWE